MELNTRQQKVVEANDPYILCLASAASGKTRTLTERIRHLIEVKKVPPRDIVAISFTNMAADEIKRRIGTSCEGAYIGTVHGYANGVCLENNIDTARWIKSFDFDEIIRQAMRIPQSKYRKVKHILIDECQDLSPLEYNFLEKIPSENRFYCGDNRQNIYQFKGCTDEYLVAMYYNNTYAKYFLTENYRNAPNIIDFAEGYIYNANPIGPPSQAVKTQDGVIEKCNFTEALDELEWSNNWGSWFILTRTNNELVEAQDLCNERGIPNVTFKKGDLDLLQLDALVSSNKVKILTIHSAKGLENKNVIVTGARTYNEEERKICYVAATRAENTLYWCPAIAKRHKKGQGLKRRAEAGRIFDKSGDSIIF
jgi:superfamily I DNA/RNA helicase